uniref:Spermatid-specific manchette-related protein 1 n=1 Tax=Geotrypetes seraphini TaxID=260995 RepID=A0A6P8QUV1_GEOSA|nr:spermatid-specific manchette-related protein 1 [Geotrypetes seraphini]
MISFPRKRPELPSQRERLPLQHAVMQELKKSILEGAGEMIPECWRSKFGPGSEKLLYWRPRPEEPEAWILDPSYIPRPPTETAMAKKLLKDPGRLTCYERKQLINTLNDFCKYRFPFYGDQVHVPGIRGVKGYHSPSSRRVYHLAGRDYWVDEPPPNDWYLNHLLQRLVSTVPYYDPVAGIVKQPMFVPCLNHRWDIINRHPARFDQRRHFIVYPEPPFEHKY